MVKQQGSILKGFIIYLVVAFGLFVAVVEITRLLQSPVESTTRQFFESVKKKNVGQAYTMLTKRAQLELTPYDFLDFLKKYDFYSYKSSNWDVVEETKFSARITGHIILINGTYLKMDIGLVRESSDQVILSGKNVELKDVPFSQHLKVWKIDRINVN